MLKMRNNWLKRKNCQLDILQKKVSLSISFKLMSIPQLTKYNLIMQFVLTQPKVSNLVPSSYPVQFLFPMQLLSGQWLLWVLNRFYMMPSACIRENRTCGFRGCSRWAGLKLKKLLEKEIAPLIAVCSKRKNRPSRGGRKENRGIWCKI